MKNLVEKRIETVDRFGEPAVEVRYVYQEPDINEYIRERNGKAYDDRAMNAFFYVASLLLGVFLGAYYVVYATINTIKSFFKKDR